MYGYGYRYNSGLVLGAGGGAPFANTYSLDFDGVDTSIQIPALDIDTTSDLTLSCWVKSNGFTTWDYLCTDGSTGGANSLLNLRFSGGGALFSSRFGSSVYTGLNGFADGNWHHIAMTINYTNGDVKFYKDGVVSSTVLTWGSVGTTARIASIGAINSSGSGSMSGSVDEFAVFQGLQNISDLYNGGTPTDLTDLSPNLWLRNGDNGAYKSPQWLIPNNENKDKVSNYSFELDGIDDYINIPNNTDLNFSSAYSVSFWIKTTSSALLSPISNQSKFLIRLYAPVNQIRLQLYDGSNGFLNLDNTQVFNDGNWHHIAFTTEATTTADKVIVYFDGVALTNKGTQTNIGSHLSAFPYEIGRNSGTWNFNGGIDEVSIYDSELSASQINDIYNGGTPTTISGAIAHYKMGEEATFSGGVWTVPDSAGSNNGTSNAMTIDDRVGEAPNSTSNSVSYNMDEIDRVEDTP